MTHRGRIRLVSGLGYGIVLAITAFASLAQPPPRQVTDIELWKMIIRDSIAAYPRSCPCPYSADRLGQPCGDRSAYFRATSAGPVCYPQDIPEPQLARYREKFQ